METYAERLQREELEVDFGFDRQIPEGNGRTKRVECEIQASIIFSLSSQ